MSNPTNGRLGKVVNALGYPSWVPEALTWLFVGTAISVQLYVTSSDYDIVSFGSKSLQNTDSLGVQVITWLPAVAFVAACVLCTLRRADKTLVAMGFGLLAYGLTHGSEAIILPSQKWGWGVALAFACLLLPMLGKIVWWTLAFIGLARPAEIVKNFFVRWGGKRIEKANARVSAANA
ncbi:MAG TPA: hypothetical protein VFP35_03425 [Candidatus Saccharimonadales bacterium]|nr:hypothetical protein [Candidatus Saccharimonadales bacterium]